MKNSCLPTQKSFDIPQAGSPLLTRSQYLSWSPLARRRIYWGRRLHILGQPKVVGQEQFRETILPLCYQTLLALGEVADQGLQTNADSALHA